MSDTATLKEMLRTATTLIKSGNLEKAGTLLDAVSVDPNLSQLGSITALGIPRKLHSARLKLAKAKGNQSARIALQYHLIPPVDLLSPLFRSNGEDRRSLVDAASKPVPKVLHQIWIGSEPPETTQVWREYAERQGWSYLLWDEPALHSLDVTADPVFSTMVEKRDFPGAVDVARYHILRAQGGLYLDCDWMPIGNVPIDAVIPSNGLSALAEETPRLTGTGSPFFNNSVIAAPKAHPTFDKLLSTLPKVFEVLPDGPAWWVTGPLVFTLASRAGPVSLLDAGISAGPFKGNRSEVDAEIRRLSAAPNAAFLLGWKPWE
jgi:mannosyltransferase OCH1-like enzyme